MENFLLFNYQLRKSAAEAINSNQATRLICSVVAPNAISAKTAEMWFKRFLSGNLEDNPRPGRPTSINLDSLKSLIETDHEEQQSVDDYFRHIGKCRRGCTA